MSEQPFFVPSTIISAIAIPRIIGIIPPNRWFGVRTPRTLADEKVWYRANRFGGCAFLVSSIIYFAVAKMFPAPKPTSSNHTLWALHLCAFLLSLAASVILAAKYAKA
jgi:uncharacterized membrane protein